MSTVKHPDVKVKLTERDGNSFAILGAVSKALRAGGYGDEVDSFIGQATSGDYDHLLRTAMSWVDVS